MMGAAKPTEVSPLVAGSSSDDDAPLPPFSFRELLRFTGPGLMMSLAYIDPGNLEVRHRDSLQILRRRLTPRSSPPTHPAPPARRPRCSSAPTPARG